MRVRISLRSICSCASRSLIAANCCGATAVLVGSCVGSKLHAEGGTTAQPPTIIRRGIASRLRMAAPVNRSNGTARATSAAPSPSYHRPSTVHCPAPLRMHTDDLTEWMHDHVFDQGSAAAERGTRAVVWITLIMMVVEIAAGWWYNSMALLADG